MQLKVRGCYYDFVFGFKIYGNLRENLKVGNQQFLMIKSRIPIQGSVVLLEPEAKPGFFAGG